MKSPIVLAGRLRAMSPDEIRTRLRGLLRQHADEWLWRCGRNALQPKATSQPHVATTKFFFDRGMAPILSQVVAQRLPGEAASVIDTARRIQSSRFDLLGFTELSFGSQPAPNWHLDPVHGIQARRQAWFCVPYLNFGAVGDHKIVWELNRHQFLSLLARAWLFTGDAGFLQSLESLWRDWHKNNPYPLGINWASALEVAFRSLSWIWVDHLIETAGHSKDRFRAELRQAIGEHATYIDRYLSTYSGPNTHLLGEVLALFSIGLLYPQFERAQAWRERGWQVLLQQSQRQVRADGFHFEQSIYYHVYALDMFLWARILAARNNILIPPEFDGIITGMVDGLSTLGSRGAVPRFGDDDGGRLFDGRRNRTEHMLDPLATASILYQRGDWKLVAGDVREESIWLLGGDGVRTFDELRATAISVQPRAFAGSGYYVMQSPSGMAVIDAGPHGWANAGHGHADALSLQLIANGQAWLTDPGSYAYPQEQPERNRFRSTAAHNTLEVDGRSQAEPVHSFAWRFHPTVSVGLRHTAPDIAVFHGSHDGYQRLSQPVAHERWVIQFEDSLWLVRDVAKGEGSHRLDVRWHFAPGCKPALENNGYSFATEKGMLRLLYAENPGWRAWLEHYEFSSAYGAKQPAPVLRLSYGGPLPAESCVILALGDVKADFCRIHASGAAAYMRRDQMNETFIAFAVDNGNWSVGLLTNDARFLILQCRQGQLKRLLCHGGTHIEVAGSEFEVPASTNRVFDWRATDGTPSIFPSTTVEAMLQSLQPASQPHLYEIAPASADKWNDP